MKWTDSAEDIRKKIESLSPFIERKWITREEAEQSFPVKKEEVKKK